MRLLKLLPRLEGPPPSLPRLLDLASDRWWGLPPRGRLAAGALALTLLVTGVGLPRLLDDGPTQIEVLVAPVDLPAGHEIAPGDLHVHHRPAAHAPEQPAETSAAGTLVTALPQGSVLTDHHLREGGLGALVEPGHVAVALPAALLADHARPGTAITIVTTHDPAGGPGAMATARVLHLDGEHLWVEVADTEAAEVASAVGRGAVAVAIRPVDEGS